MTEPTKEYQGYIFDCDGTLTDSMPLHFMAWRSTMEQRGIELSEDRFYQLAGMPTDKIVKLLAQQQGVSVDVEVAAAAKEQAFYDLMHQLKPILQTLEIVNRVVEAGKKFAVASGGTREAVEMQLQAIGLADVFAIRVCAEDTKRHKPEPDVFLRAAELMKVDPSACVVYEDADLGIEAAKAAGMGFVDIRTYHMPARITG